ncbi:MAG: hypothetical protein P4M13_01295 [Alphaproteobacteria bacterium]|nr:hypothetical protein [Alphaproteobacteria bacterium]
MAAPQLQKPGLEEWQSWAEVVVDQLTRCVHVYKKPPHIDVFMAEAERQRKNDFVIKLLHRIHPLLDQSASPTDSVSDLQEHDERTISGLIVLFGEVLENLPWLSADMQKLLKSPWMKNFPNKTAEELFFGESGDESHGIGSGQIENGRLPASLNDLLEREQTGDSRRPREDLLVMSGPSRHDIEARARWVEQTTRSLHGTAGRVE